MSFLLGTSARFIRRVYSLITPELLFIALFFLVAAWNCSFAQRVKPRLGCFRIFFLGFSALFFTGERLITVHSSGSCTPDSIGDLVDFFLWGAVAEFQVYFLSFLLSFSFPTAVIVLDTPLFCLKLCGWIFFCVCVSVTCLV